MNEKRSKAYESLVYAVTGEEELLPIREQDVAVIDKELTLLDKDRDGRSFAEILKLRFGLDGEGIRTLKVVGRILGGVSGDCIRQQEARALQVLRRRTAFQHFHRSH